MLKILMQGLGVPKETIDFFTSLSHEQRNQLLTTATRLANQIADALKEGGEIYIRKPDGTMTKLEV